MSNSITSQYFCRNSLRRHARQLAAITAFTAECATIAAGMDVLANTIERSQHAARKICPWSRRPAESLRTNRRSFAQQLADQTALSPPKSFRPSLPAKSRRVLRARSLRDSSHERGCFQRPSQWAAVDGIDPSSAQSRARLLAAGIAKRRIAPPEQNTLHRGPRVADQIERAHTNKQRHALDHLACRAQTVSRHSSHAASKVGSRHPKSRALSRAATRARAGCQVATLSRFPGHRLRALSRAKGSMPIAWPNPSPTGLIAFDITTNAVLGRVSDTTSAGCESGPRAANACQRIRFENTKASAP